MKNNLHSPFESVEKTVVFLRDKGWNISFAESCTGGMAAATLVDVAGASRVFNESFVTYSNDAKIKRLGVSPDTIAQNGVVSESVVAEMARGVARVTASQVGVGISGIAGPDGGTPKKPVGTVCFGFFVNGETYTFTKFFDNMDRYSVRQSSVKFVFDFLAEILDK